MPSVIVVGGGLAGLSAAAALGGAGFSVDLYESRGFLGGRATSFPVSPVDESDVIDNCQHVLLRCCVNLLDFYRRLGADQRIRFYNEYNFLEPGGRLSTLRASGLSAPLHLASAFLRMKCFGLADKIAIGAGMLSIERERNRKDLDRITMMEWLREKHQTNSAIERFWRQIFVSAVNEDLERMAASHGFQVFWLGMLSRPEAFEMGIPDVPLRELYGQSAWSVVGDVRIHLRCAVERILIDAGAVAGVVVGGQLRTADAYVCAVPFERVNAIAPGLDIDTSAFQHSPITGIHLWFDRPVTDLPHAALLDRTMQWMFNKSGGRYVQFVVSASRCLIQLSRPEVVDLALRDGGEFFPLIREAKVERAQVIKELRATFSAAPGLEACRPVAVTKIPGLFLAGDWTRSGWPATMEGAVRSGYLAAEAVSAAAGEPTRFLLPDIA
ncbi:MAG: FAD-dependent oxidoreductase [Candidatus Solibacter usitatus]|nr:FAD-dependent oxidoreductase [Candidatus Solibacter usitatus]